MISMAQDFEGTHFIHLIYTLLEKGRNITAS